MVFKLLSVHMWMSMKTVVHAKFDACITFVTIILLKGLA